MINAYSNSKQQKDISNAERAEAVLKEMQALYNNNQYSFKPDRISYSSTITGYANEGRPLDAERVLALMIEEYRNGDTRCKPDTIAYTVREIGRLFHLYTCMSIFFFIPGLVIYLYSSHCSLATFLTQYQSVINAWAQSGEQGAADRATQFLHQMEKLSAEHDEDVRPSKITYGCVIK